MDNHCVYRIRADLDRAPGVVEHEVSILATRNSRFDPRALPYVMSHIQSRRTR